MGGGAVLDGRPLSDIPGAKKMVPAVDAFIENIRKDAYSPESLYYDANGKMPAWMAAILAAALTLNVKRDLKKHGIDYKAESPYAAFAFQTISDKK